MSVMLFITSTPWYVSSFKSSTSSDCKLESNLQYLKRYAHNARKFSEGITTSVLSHWSEDRALENLFHI